MEMLLLYYIFSILFMIGYIDINDMKTWEIIASYFLMLIVAPIVFPINVGYYFRKNS